MTLTDMAIADLRPAETAVLRLLKNRRAVLIDRAWRVRGAPAQKLNVFALATLLGAGLVRRLPSQAIVLTQEGDRLAARMAEKRLPSWLVNA